MSFVGYAIVLAAVVAGALLLGERLPVQLLPAALLIGLGFWLVQRTPSITKEQANEFLIRNELPPSSSSELLAA